MKFTDLVVIVIPIYKSLIELSPSEILSIDQAVKVFCNRQIYFVGPKKLNTDSYKEYFEHDGRPFIYMSFSNDFFLDIDGYNKFCTNSKFYKRFREFKYLLIYQTDAFVFTDDLDFWCNKDYDYIGAPWFVGFDKPKYPIQFLGVGNGGLSLRNTRTFYKITNSIFFFGSKFIIKLLNKTSYTSTILNKTSLKKFYEWLVKYKGQEDVFWGLIVSNYYKSFKVPSPYIALKFSFEVNPKYLFQLNNEELPMGCHAWEKYDYSFWKHYINVS